ncbi:MAG: Crp/Fnr family transcriptional regulator [Ardenticatenaceae bacterium]|nr:Crp/Fnr family transcriptional regulator [Anaerolineales bacterium]MCB9007974.1 Crp/Fnr family transcriptional regulator [Ardenticatenaceae bacterium]
METAVNQEIITRCALLDGLTEEECSAIIQRSKHYDIAQDRFFFQQGEDATMMYIIMSGRVKLTQVTQTGDQVIVGYQGAGDGLGIIVALSEMEYPLSAEAVTDCQAVCWPREHMKELMLAYPRLAINGMGMIAQRFVKLQDQYRDIATRRVEQRVARALLRLVRQFGKKVEGGVLVDMPLTRQDLAEMTGTNVYNVSRILSKWERVDWIASQRQRIVLCKAHELVVLAEDL